MLRVLGPLEVEGPAGVAPIPPGRQQAVLARLLLDANQVVATDHLVDVLWDHDPPDTARTQIQICVSRLRKTLTTGGVAASISTRSPGYVLQTDPGEIDVRVFEEGVSRARELTELGRHAEAAAELRAAIDLWRGPSLSGITNPALRSRALRLDEERLDAWETLLSLQLEMGLHHQIVGELSRLVHDHPLRERARALYMMVLYRAGRQAEALETYRIGRELLVGELGLEPGELLRSLEAAILSDDPGLRPAAVVNAEPAAVLGAEAPAVIASSPEIESRPVPTPPARPRQLPADIADFVPDDTVLAQAEEVLVTAHRQRAVGVVAVVGPAGIGKSALAAHIGHRVADEHFPDGQLYCDMQATRGEPPTPADALGRFLNALGIPGPMVPSGLAERGEMYRTLLADRRILVVIDDAPGEAHVLPLLPGSSSCAVLVTSRSRMTGLPGVRRVELGPLDRERGLALLGRVAGAERVRREPDSAETLVATVGGLPLAVRIIAARLAARPHWTLAEMVRRLDDEQHRLDELAYGDMTVRASLAMTHDGLDPAARELFSLIGVVDGPSWPSWVAGALLDDHRPFPADLLEPLLDVQMVDVITSSEGNEPRFRLQDVIRLFAREKLAERPDSTVTADAAVRRLVGGWLGCLQAAHRAVYGGDYTVLHGAGIRWTPPAAHLRRLADGPLSWFDVERASVATVIGQAAEAGLDELCWDLAVTATTFYETRGNLDDWEHTHQIALGVVRAAGNERGIAALRASLGTLYISRSRPEQARTELTSAARVFEVLDDPLGMALCHRDLALIGRRAGDDVRSAALYALALGEFDRAGDVVGRAIVLTQRAELRAQLDGIDDAYADLEEAMTLQSDLGYVGGVAHTMRRIGQLQSAAGEHRRAVGTLTEVLELVRDIGDLIGETHLLRNLGEVNEAAGRHLQAVVCFEDALAACERIMDRRGAATARLALARSLGRSGQAGRAVAMLEVARRSFSDTGMVSELAATLAELGTVQSRPA